ncbi:MAG: bifunctional oligoribonuclease/PAP phosphatase NrnA [Candidatus Omnitrophica bacterium]|nr:bifunctional oligoribonuclease/PAP phosphatase NrnA [Candidatus Omnitrophota bacterium]
MSLKKAIACIRGNNNFLITSHTNLEADALGSELSFYRLLKAIGKQATIVNQDNTPPEYYFLPGINNIEKLNRKFFAEGESAKGAKKNLKDIEFDCFVTLDCSNLGRCGEVAKLNTKDRPILNIDHHISNERFGNINWIEPDSSSCCQMIYKLYKGLGVTLNKDIAMLLYAGILTDTGSFRHSNTSSLTHKIASELLKFNLDVVGVYKNVYENIAFEDMRLLNKIQSTVRRDFNGKVAWFEVKQSLIKNKKISFDLSEYILSFARAIKDVEVAVLFKENLDQKNEVRVNFRSQGKVDVNKIAQFFGGGGHKTASGCTIKGKIDEVRRRVLVKIRESLK